MPSHATAPATQTTARAVETFCRTLTRELAGKTNAGARAALRDAARTWDTHDHETLRQAVQARASRIAFTASGRAAVDAAIQAAEHVEAAAVDGDPWG